MTVTELLMTPPFEDIVVRIYLHNPKDDSTKYKEQFDLGVTSEYKDCIRYYGQRKVDKHHDHIMFKCTKNIYIDGGE